MAIRVIFVILSDLCMCFRSVLWDLMVSAWFVLFAKICRSVGVVNLFEIGSYWYGFRPVINSIILSIFRNICLEILINLRIYLVFMRISLCILWNPWISVVNLQYFNLKSIQNLSFSNLFLTSPPSVPLSDSDGRESLHLKFTSLGLF